MTSSPFHSLPRLFAALCTLVAAPAHAAHGDIAGLGDGILHVMAGSDHLLAAVAVGLWSMAYAWRRAWLLPLAFLSAMLAAAWLAIGRATPPPLELMIVASLIVMGGLIFSTRALPLSAALVICAAFGAIHGFAHGTEAGSSGAYPAYIAGLGIATAALHFAGIGLGLMLRVSSRYGMRVAGVAIALTGVWLAFGLAATTMR